MLGILAVAGVVFALGLAWVMLELERSRVDTDFTGSAREHAAALERGWSAQLHAVDLLAMVFNTSRHVTRDEFARASRSLLERNASIRALEWVPKVSHEEREAFVEQARRTVPDFEFVDIGPGGDMQPIGRRDVYYPIYYIEPLASNRRALGYDPAGNDARNDALREAVESGRMAVSAPTRLVQDVPTSSALLVFVPVYERDADLSTPSARRRSLEGLTEGVYMVDALSEDALGAIDSQGIRVVIYAFGDHGREFITRYADGGSAEPGWYTWGRPDPLSRRWSVGNRTFEVVIHAAGLPYAYDLRAPLAVLVLSVLLTATVVAVLALLIQQERRSRTLAELRRDQLRHQATHDALTGLVNRGAFELELADALEGGGSGDVFSLCYLDLDEFKVVNDIHGYQVGDDLLRQIVGRLTTHVRPGDIFARLGGDEFAVLLADTQAEQASAIAEQYLRVVAEYRFRNGERTVAVSMCIGITEIDRRASSIGEALGEADAACHIAKEQGRNRIHVFRSGDTISDQYRGQMLWATEVRQALDDGRLELHGQRIVPADPGSREEVLLEVLVRLRDRNGDLVPPGDFIPAAERYNLMADVDRWVIANAIALRAANPGEAGLWCINLSGHSIGEEDVFEFIRRRLAEHEVAPGGICFEVTETAVVRSLSSAERFIAGLRELGCRVALDDFGSGMSSFVYLKHLPVDFLKIDGSFVRNIQHDRMDRAMVHAIQEIAAELGIRTIAEYVETATARAEVRALGVDFVQGFHIGRPEPIPIAGREERAAHRLRAAT